MTLVNLSGYQFGVESEETGLYINVQSFSISLKPEFKEFVMDKAGEKVGFAAGTTESSFNISGQVKSQTGVASLVFTTALTVANDKDYHGQSAGGIYMDEATTSQEYNGFRTFSITASRNAGVT